jgi:predicted Zn-dependent peptidase
MSILTTLPNGVRILALPMPHLQSASVGVFLRVGSRDESAASNGISHVLEHMAFKGTATRSVQAINLDAERLGADVNAYTSKDTTGYYMTGLGRHAGEFLRMTADIVLHSTFPPEELQRELEVIRQEAIEFHEDPEECSGALLDRALWGEHPLGMPVIGSVENIERFTRDDLVAHVHAHYVADKTVVVGAGNFDVDGFVASARELFGGMRRGAAAAPAPVLVAPPARGEALGERFAQVSQVFLTMAWPLAPTRPEDLAQPRWRMAASLASTLFGGGMSAPLVDTVRERLGLAYHAESHVEQGDSWFNLIVYAVTTPDKLAQLMTATGGLLRELAQRIDAVQLERAKNQVIVARVREAERTYASMERAVDELFLRGATMAPQEAVALVESITEDEVRAVFAQMAATRPALAVTGKGATGKAARELAALLA